ncbi:MAG: GntR family transcriptional regulator [Pseudomonadota bacterium]
MATHPAHLFSIVTGSSEPLYRQLVEQVRRLAAGGQLAPGDAMPSVRDIASTLAVNPMTVSKAYSILELEGVLVRQRGQGMLVAEAVPRAHSVAKRVELLRPTLEKAVLEARQLELDPATVLALFTKIMKEHP